MYQPTFFANEPITEPDLSVYPCLTQTDRASWLSDRYKHVRTMDVIDHMRSRDFLVTQVHASRITSQAGQFGKHVVRMRPIMTTQQVGDALPELVIQNSHDGTSRCALTVGLFRVACANGMIVGSHGDFSYDLSHVGDVRQQVFNIIDDSMNRVPQLSDAIRQWDARRLSPAEVIRFAEEAKVLRFGPEDPKVTLIDNVRVTQVRRPEDAGDTLWKVFNRVQENLSKGGQVYRRTVTNGRSRNQSVRSLTAPAKVVTFNRRLWDLAEEFLPA